MLPSLYADCLLEGTQKCLLTERVEGKESERKRPRYIDTFLLTLWLSFSFTDEETETMKV